MDLSACSSEPIHVPGSIQPHGILVVVDPGTGLIVAAAGDVASMLDVKGDAVGQPLQNLVGLSLSRLIEVAGCQPGQEPIFLGTTPAHAGHPEHDILAHEQSGQIIVELEPSGRSRPSAARLLADLRVAVAAINGASTLEVAAQAAVVAVRALTGFTRVVAYRFLEDGSGRVIAEDGGGTLGSLLNQHFPESDIPAQARALYCRNLVRVIPDVAYVPAPLLPESAGGLDMSDCTLRSVSPVHIQYLKNMGVASSMSVSVMQGQGLWGLLACHGDQPVTVRYEAREACKHLAAAFAQRIETIQARRLLQEGDQLANRREDLLAQLVSSGTAEAEIKRRLPELLALVPASGVVVCHQGKVVTHGITPLAADSLALCVWSMQQSGTAPYSTAVLSQVCPPARAYMEQVSGLIAISVGDDDPLQVLWLRPEYAETIEWAGHPYKGADGMMPSGSLSPRTSFEAWRQIVRGRAQSWSNVEVYAVGRFADGFQRICERQKLNRLGIAMIHMSRISAMGTMASTIAHEINQPLASLQNYASALSRMLQRGSEGDPDVATVVDCISDQALRAGDIVRQLRRLVAREGDSRKRISLDEVVGGAYSLSLMGMPQNGVTSHIEVAPDLTIHADSVQIQQVIINLIRNSLDAMQALEDGTERRLAIFASRVPGGLVQITIQDSGRGLADGVREKLFSAFNSGKEDGPGIGLSVCRTIVEAHGGKIWADEPADGGMAFSFTLRELPAGDLQ